MRRSRSETVYISESQSTTDFMPPKHHLAPWTSSSPLFWMPWILARYGSPKVPRAFDGYTRATGARRLRSPYYCRAWQESLIFGRFAAMADALECSDTIDSTWSSESLRMLLSSRVRGRLSPIWS